MKVLQFCHSLHGGYFRERRLGAILRTGLKSFSTESDSYGSGERLYNFGFKKVTEEIKSKLVYNLFSHVSNKYDLMNDLMSLRLHRCWKDQLVKELDLFLKYHSYKMQEEIHKWEAKCVSQNRKGEEAASWEAASDGETSPSEGNYFRDGEGQTGSAPRHQRAHPSEAINEGEESCANCSTCKILDLAGGTGDIAFRILERYKYFLEKITQGSSSHGGQGHPDKVYSRFTPEIIVADVNRDMIQVGKKRAKERNYESNIKWVIQNAENLTSFDDNSIDIVTLSFGIRNFTNIPKSLREIHRVLKPGGRFLCLEFSKVNCAFFKPIYNAYLSNFIPLLGKFVASSEDSYKYLAESIQTFLTPDELSQLMYQNSFRNISYSSMTMGIVAIHSSYKIV
ncbi:ubiquinone biosynthesis methyltransferase [Plasmodium inui San Antonio 1]|uniref:2-methoxy-6-polyprenyl-1,4-benzoquinol methylase, mitochondrial n=1 Tax=Plasmodium inui San Antonio 1 TaxID=1237626 RepID=W7A6K7_9APIC|nr:ubiquinone biosynthesis methyltransferase [Plasmodium inui San Antonio 1]EUD66863.1 ubiquinone biosynthesis methyltransferase [Plasmodium inui San Antonio 1]